jgi:CTP-dependent riboflavin kinase
MRPTYILRRPGGLPTGGVVFSGSGSNGRHLARVQDELAAFLGYVPYPGSLNVRTKYAFRLGAYAAEFVDQHRGKGGRRGGDYQVWHARIAGYDGPAHVMRPGRRGHGRYVLEVWAPVPLKEVLGIGDGDTVKLSIGA